VLNSTGAGRTILEALILILPHVVLNNAPIYLETRKIRVKLFISHVHLIHICKNEVQHAHAYKLLRGH